MSRSFHLLVLGFSLASLVGCSEQAEQAAKTPEVTQQATPATPAQAAQPTPPSQPAPQPGGPAVANPHQPAGNSPAADPHAGIQMPGAGPARYQGQVVQILEAKPYTYLEVDTGRGQSWLAASGVNVAPGDVVTWADQAVMRAFKSKALDRTFDEVLFVAGLQPAQAGAAGAAGAASRGKVISAASSAGYTYIEVETPQGGRWLAAPTAPVKAGDEISWSGGSTMHNFTSKSLNQTFAEIDFVGGVSVHR